METESIDNKTSEKKKTEDKHIEKEKVNDIVTSLEITSHVTTRYPNGLILGVRMEAIPGTCGVHVDIVFVLDLREATFGKGGLAMRAAVLETINRSIDRILNDIGLGECMYEYAVMTPFGRVRLPLMRRMSNRSFSLMHETRTVYVITKNAKPTTDLSWLTDSSRIVTADQFTLMKQSDARSKLPELKKSVEQSKWSLLEQGLKKGWFGVISLLALILGLSSLVAVILSGTGSILLPLIASATSGALGGWLLRSSRNSVSLFVETLTREQEKLKEIGDSVRIVNSIEENEERLHLIGDLNFIVSPLVAAAGNSINNNDINTTINIACTILDECVRLSPAVSTSKALLLSDTGLRKFIGLFEHLGGNIVEEKLSLAYVGLTGHLARPISFCEAIVHVTELINSLYDVGALRPDIKASIDDHLNYESLKEALQEIDEEMATGSESSDSESDRSYADDSKSVEEAVTNEVANQPEEDELAELMLNASADKVDVVKEDNSIDNIGVVASDIVKGRQRKKSKPKDATQLCLLDDFELLRADGTASKESGSAGI